MKRPRFAFRIFAVMFAASAASLLVLALSSSLAMRRLYVDSTLTALAQTATSLANFVPPSGAENFCSSAAAGTGLRITLIAADGSVLGDSASDPLSMDNHSARAEVAGALSGRVSTSMRRSPTLGLDMAYAAAPVIVDGAVTGVLRVAMGATELSDRLAPFIVASTTVAVAMMAAMAFASARLGASINGPVTALMEASRDWSSGKLGRRLRRFDDPELAPLSDTMNAMASDLADRIVAMERQGNELAAILDAMEEAVLSVDADLVIHLANPSAASLLAAAGPRSSIEGLTVLQASGNTALDAMAKRCVSGNGREEAEVALYGDETRRLLVHASPLSLEGGRPGALLVLSDITRLKQLERVRQDFVANVSHELRTPITLIKGFAETLDEVEDPAEAKRFLAIIKRHADRMASIVEDLLTLARLESPERGILETSVVDAARVLDRATESLGNSPSDRGVSLVASVEAGLSAQANEGLLEQALVNLLDNAVKYSPRGSTVHAEAAADGDFARFSIRDKGPGIPARDLPRLFERFYRVDRARSRELGGTGLGLAIVRHIALAHHGDVSVESREGSGSTFFLRVPLCRPGAPPQGPDSVQATSPEADSDTASS